MHSAVCENSALRIRLTRERIKMSDESLRHRAALKYVRLYVYRKPCEGSRQVSPNRAAQHIELLHRRDLRLEA
jgi:hypothetical protein